VCKQCVLFRRPASPAGGDEKLSSTRSEPARSALRPLARMLLWRFPASELTATLAFVLAWVCVILVIVVVLLLV
jgi:hypothetical protein